jgi:hypothetical protein
MPGFASLTAAADAYRGRLKTRFFNEIDVNRAFWIANSPAHGPSLRRAEASPAFWFEKVAAAACYSQSR